LTNRESDEALFNSIKEHANYSICIKEIDANINDERFAEHAVNALLEMI
tara:strand:+ start:16708 stop:16854 length:147 start_codon:yes stop_codon:yes gene_type:complete